MTGARRVSRRERPGPVQGPPGRPGGRGRGDRGRLQAARPEVPPRRLARTRVRRADGAHQPGVGDAARPDQARGRRPRPGPRQRHLARGSSPPTARPARRRPASRPGPRRRRPPGPGGRRGPTAAGRSRASQDPAPAPFAAGAPAASPQLDVGPLDRGIAATTRSPRGAGSAGPPPGNPSGSLVTFGRYDGWTLGEIARTDLEYLEWLDRMPIGRTYQAEIDVILRKAGRGGSRRRRRRQRSQGDLPPPLSPVERASAQARARLPLRAVLADVDALDHAQPDRDADQRRAAVAR